MSANELLHEIDSLPEDQRRWLINKLLEIVSKEQTEWAKFSVMQLAGCYGPQDSIYDEE